MTPWRSSPPSATQRAATPTSTPGTRPSHCSTAPRWPKAVGTTDLPDDAPSRDAVSIIFRADDLDETCCRLADAGVEFVAEPTDRPEWGIRVAHLRDPDGTLLEVNESLETA